MRIAEPEDEMTTLEYERRRYRECHQKGWVGFVNYSPAVSIYRNYPRAKASLAYSKATLIAQPLCKRIPGCNIVFQALTSFINPKIAACVDHLVQTRKHGITPLCLFLPSELAGSCSCSCSSFNSGASHPLCSFARSLSAGDAKYD